MNKNNHGFTLIELIVTLAVVSVLLLTGIPMLNQMTTNNRLVTQINSIAGSLSLARSESIKRGSSITLCGSTDGATCDTSNWEAGWIVFADADNNAVLSSTAGTSEAMLKIVNQFSGGTTLRLSQSDSTSIIRYKSDGGLRDIDVDATQTNRGTFTLCDNALSTTTAKAINVNPIGRVSRAEGATPTAKPVLDVTGVAITCP
ncbi:MAG: GspH/FimT family pseudopilin [Woeseiaceae bacterium]